MNKTVDYILEVARCSGITKAANNLYITPSALSKFVQTKESELQVKLFNRTGKKFILTYAGERYVAMLQQMLELRQQMDAEMSRISSMYMGRLRVGFQISCAHIVITNIIPEFQANYPGIQIMLEENNSIELVKMLKNNQLDVIITTLDHPLDDFSCEILSEGELVLVVPSNSPLCKKSISQKGFKYPWINFNECADQKTIMLSKEQIFRYYSDQIYDLYNIKPDISILAKTTRTALLCVANGMGVTITLDLLVFQNSYQNKVKILSFGESRIRSQLTVVSSKNNMLFQEIHSLVEICKKYILY